jgi:3-isopropylmalate dehydrogenase
MRLGVLVLPGDGIGPEVIEAAIRVLEVVAADAGVTLDLSEDLLHGAAYDVHGSFCTEATLARARAADAVLVGAVGGPRWDGLLPDAEPEERDGLMRLRRALDTYAGLRPARAWDALRACTPYREQIVTGVDVVVVREMSGGVYFAQPRGIHVEASGAYAIDTTRYASGEIERIARAAFELARRRKRRLLSVDKANVMENGVLWRSVVGELGVREYPDVALAHAYADNASYQLCMQPAAFDVVLADNLFGDLLSDQLASVAGSLGMLPSASLPGLAAPGEPRPGGLYEPVHGSAPDIAGRGIANPIGAVLSVGLLLEHACGRADLNARIERAVGTALAEGMRPPDLGGSAATLELADALIAAWRRA